jgi:hypothetical protein
MEVAEMSIRQLKFLCSAALLWNAVLSVALAQPAQIPAPPQSSATLFSAKIVPQPTHGNATFYEKVEMVKIPKNDDMEVAVELRVISMPESFWEQAPLELPAEAKQPNGFTCLNDAQLHRFMEAIQGNANISTMAAPKVTMFDGQASTIQACDTQFFTTGIDIRWNGQQMLAVPKNEACALGLNATFLPRVTADHRFVCLTTDVKLSNLDSAAIPLSPVTLMVTPVYEGGAQGAPVPFTQFVQEPHISKIAVNKTFCIPDGGTALFFGGKHLSEGVVQTPVPVLTKVPYITRLFTTTAKKQETECVLFLVTPRIIVDQEVEKPLKAETAPPPRVVLVPTQAPLDSYVEESEPGLEQCGVWSCPGGESHLHRLLRQYQEACIVGHKTEARQIAAAALEIDPTCFSKGK